MWLLNPIFLKFLHSWHSELEEVWSMVDESLSQVSAFIFFHVLLLRSTKSSMSHRTHSKNETKVEIQSCFLSFFSLQMRIFIHKKASNFQHGAIFLHNASEIYFEYCCSFMQTRTVMSPWTLIYWVPTHHITFDRDQCIVEGPSCGERCQEVGIRTQHFSGTHHIHI